MIRIKYYKFRVAKYAFAIWTARIIKIYNHHFYNSYTVFFFFLTRERYRWKRLDRSKSDSFFNLNVVQHNNGLKERWIGYHTGKH